MKTILRVAKTELRTLFFSPIAWFLMIVFLIQCSIVYTGLLEGIVKQQELGGFRMNFLKALTSRVFVNPGGLFNDVMQKLYLYIPLLTMGLISRETSSGTIKLLYSSPIKVREIVFGKYLAMIVYSLVLVAIVTIFVISGISQIESPDTGMLMTALLGFFLLLCAYAAIGLFMSSLTTYQVVAAICTFVMIGILSYIGNMWQDIAFVRELTYFLSIRGRTQKMLGGLLTTKDVIYFIVIVYIFLGLTIYKLKAGMESKPALVKASRYLFIVVSALLIGYVSSLPGFIGYYDATANKSRTLTPQVQKIIAELGEEPLTVTAYNNMLGRFWSLGDPKSYNENLARWESYMRFKDNIKLNTICYYDSILDNSLRIQTGGDQTLKGSAEHFAKTMDIDLADVLTPAEIRKIIDLRPELNRYVMLLEWKGRSTFLRVFNDQRTWPGETEVAAAFKRLLQAKLPKVAFLTGDLERDINKKGDKEYQTLTRLSTFRYALVNQGFDVDTVSLESQEIPAGISTLVVADPKIALTPVTMEKLRRYIANGGNMLITSEPGRQEIINPLLEQLGVQLMDGTIVQASKDYSPDLVTPYLTETAAGFSRSLAASREDSIKISMPGVAGLSFSPEGPFRVQPLLVTDSTLTWNKIKKLDLDLISTADAGSPARLDPATSGRVQLIRDGAVSTLKRRAPQVGRVTFSPADGDTKGAIPTVLSLTRQVQGKEQRIVVTGDADFMSNVELKRNNMRTANFVFNTALFSWLSYGEFPIDASRPESQDNSIDITSRKLKFLKIVYTFILPGILLAFATVMLIRRKRK